MRRRWKPYPVDETCKLYLPFYKYGGEQSKIWDISTSHNDGTITGAVPWGGGFTVAQSSMKISGVAGTAFVDWGFNGGLYPGRRVVIKSNTNGAQITGFVGALGTAETLDSELVVDGTFEVDPNTNWTPTDCTIASVAGGDVGNCLEITRTGGSSQPVVSAEITKVIGTLYKFGVKIKSGTAGDKAYLVGVGTGGWEWNYSGTTTGSWVAYSRYWTAASTAKRVWLQKSDTTVGTMLFDTASLKKVLTPSATGCTIVSTRGGATQSWESQDATFNYNDSAGYTVYLEGEQGIGWFTDPTDDKFTITSLNLGKAHSLRIWLKYLGDAGAILGGAADYALRIVDGTNFGYNAGTVEQTQAHGLTAGDMVCLGVVRNGTALQFYKNGVALGTEKTLGADNNFTITTIGDYTATAAPLSAVWKEIIANNTNISAQEFRNHYEMTRYIFS